MKARSPITTHILDVHVGKPAGGVPVVLEFQADPNVWKLLVRSRTDGDGRASDLLPADKPLAAGVYRLTFATGEYFKGRGEKAFYPFVTVSFEVTVPEEHYHVPLLLSPFGYSTYRGS